MQDSKNILLSICICALPVRITKLYLLINKLNNQILSSNADNTVEILTLLDSKNILLGDKRNYLKDLAIGKYICFIDDDDDIAFDYLPFILDAMQHDTDVITFEGRYVANNCAQKDLIYTTLRADSLRENAEYRLPNHITPIKSEIVKKATFSSKNFGEDIEYSNTINLLIKSEFHIKKDLYLYQYNSSLSQCIEDTQNKNTAYRETSTIHH